ncbi:MAG: hypothetical protein NC043_08100 [Muribaculaceae bacterium]|nr:hypothetical protein [Muribaculaceae bacterium]
MYILKTFKILAIIALALLASCAAIWKWYDANHPSGSNDYYAKLTPKEGVESRYLAPGPFEVSYFEAEAPARLKNSKYGIRPI